jgi:hypothetical protein
MALVGGLDTVPGCETTSDVNNSKAWAVCDLPYGNREFDLSDSFRDIALGRLFTHSVSCGSLLASRTVNYEVMREGADWGDRFLDCGDWGWPEMRPLFQNVGYRLADCQMVCTEPMLKCHIDAQRSLETAAILHKAHSEWR